MFQTVPSGLTDTVATKWDTPSQSQLPSCMANGLARLPGQRRP